MCHHPSRFSKDCVDFDMHEEKEIKESEKPVLNDLEEAANEFANQDCVTFISRKKGFIAGAEWQYQKDRGEFAKIKAKTWCEGFDACKEQMMEEAVEGVVWWQVGKNISIRVLKGACKYLEQDDLPYKVRIIILPKDGER